MFGQAELIRYRVFDRLEWKQLLIRNRCTEKKFMNEMFDPEFFSVYDFPNYTSTDRAEDMDGFFVKEYIAGPYYDQMAIVEMQLGNKKIFRGNLHSFTGKMTFFPIVNFSHNKIHLRSSSKKTTVCAYEGSTGLVTNSTIMVHEFDPEKFHVRVTDFKAGGTGFKLLSDFIYDNEPFKREVTDSVIRSRWVGVV